MSAKKLFLAIGIWAILAPCAFAVSNGFNEAVSLYNSRRLPQALEKLTALARTNPNDAGVHYYMALCYQGTSQIAAAKTEYLWVYSKGNDARLKYNAWQALQQIDRWSQKRAYAGNGNNFQQMKASPYRSSSTQASSSSSGSGSA